MFAVITAAALLTTVFADTACTNKRGKCVDYRSYKCTAGVQTGICNGDTNRRCCLYCDATCVANDKSWSASDGGCTKQSGVCQLNSNYCAGSYSRGLCGGPSNRQCCLKSSGKWATACAGQSSNRVRGCDSMGCGSYNAPSLEKINCSFLLTNKVIFGYQRSLGSRLHKGVDVICKDGSVVYAPFTGTRQRQVKPYGDGSVIDNGIQISGSGFCIHIFYIQPDSYSGSISRGARIGYMLPMQKKYPGITSHIHIQMCDKTDPTRYL